MKTILRAIFLNLVTLYMVAMFYSGLAVVDKPITYLQASVVWTLLNKVVKPIIKLLLLPINLITLGLFSWVVNVITLFLLTYFIKGVSILAYTFPGYSSQGFVIPQMSFNLIISYVITSLILSLTHLTIIWLVKH